MGTRTGTDADAANLYTDFKKLGFRVKQYNDQTAAQMLKLMTEGKSCCDWQLANLLYSLTFIMSIIVWGSMDIQWWMTWLDIVTISASTPDWAYTGRRT